MMLNMASVLVWIAGLGFLVFGSRTRTWRALGITYLVFLGIMMALRGKDYYLAPIYPMVYAAGGVFWETLTEARTRLRWVRVAVPAAVIAMGLIAVPLVVSILPGGKNVSYLGALGIKMSRTEVQESGPLPQNFCDEFGWAEMVSEGAKGFNARPPE